MANVFDVAAYILEKSGQITAMKLQKLTYYSQAWHLAWTDTPLFPEEIQVWANGPVVYELYLQHQGKYWVDSESITNGSSDNLSPDQKDTIDSVFDAYSPLTASQLNVLIHTEAPWKAAHVELPDNADSKQTIEHSAMSEFYSKLAEAPGSVSSLEEINFPAWMT